MQRIRATDIPADDATLDAILRIGFRAGHWPFDTLPGSLPISVLLRVAERTRVLEETDASIAKAMQRNREGFRSELLALLDGVTDDTPTA